VKSAKRRAIDLWSQAIRARDGRCVPAPYFPDIRCVGALQAMHLIPKGPYPSVRFELWNGAAGCAAHHTYLTEHPLEHERFCRQILEGYDERKRQVRQVYGDRGVGVVMQGGSS
jgi:hypothetical protein